MASLTNHVAGAGELVPPLTIPGRSTVPLAEVLTLGAAAPTALVCGPRPGASGASGVRVAGATVPCP
eukprot:7242858-Heterocapsa_arctica.AAC.1